MDVSNDSVAMFEAEERAEEKAEVKAEEKAEVKKQRTKKAEKVEKKEAEVKAEEKTKEKAEVKPEVSEAKVREPQVKTKRKKTGGEIASLTVSIVLLVLMVPVLLINVILIIGAIAHPNDVPSFFGFKPLIVLSDSMYPQIKTNDLVISKEVDVKTIVVGDVISYREKNADGTLGAVITHKVAKVTIDEEGVVHITTTGINNIVRNSDGTPKQNVQGENVTYPDEPITGDQVVGKFVLRLAGFGGIIYWMQSVWGLIVCIGLPALALIIYELVKRNAELKAEKQTSASANEELEELRKKLKEMEENKENK
ncbi:MAG: signal peptidase I [bacterium]|nr:signal peptidase I [bacterium]